MGSAPLPSRDGPPGSARAAGSVRVMVVDDSLSARSALAHFVDGCAGMSVAATAGSAEVALELLAQKRVDVILLDLEMPGMGGLKAIPELLARGRGAKICVVSSRTSEGAKATLEALAMGASDTLAKPRSGGFTDAYRQDLAERIAALAGTGTTPVMRPLAVSRSETDIAPAVIAMGASTGGIHALGRLFTGLPASIDVPILVTQHLPASFMPVFARQLATMAGRPVRVAEEGMALADGEVLVAPGHGHLMLRRTVDGVVVRISDREVPSGCRPSVDPMLEAVAEIFGARGMAVVLSGMGRDGSAGAAKLHAAGGTVLAQDEDSSAVFGMPRGVVEAGIAAVIGTPEILANHIKKRVSAK